MVPGSARSATDIEALGKGDSQARVLAATPRSMTRRSGKNIPYFRMQRDSG